MGIQSHSLMFNAIALALSCMTLQWVLSTTEGQHGTNPYVFYAVEMEEGGGVPAARALAQQHGLEFISQIGSLQGLFTLRDSRGRPDRAALEKRLAVTAGVDWVQRQYNQYRDKRASISSRHHHDTTNNNTQTTQDVSDRRAEEQVTDHALNFNDPLWPMQWELFTQGQYSSSGFDLNVMPVWIRNITGNGVVVSIIDDGVDHTNKDLKRNFAACASLDLRGSHGLSHDPMPHRDEENGHGTRCAGEVAMEANNSYCGVGIAFNAKVGGIRLLDGPVTDAMEATALTFNNHLIHVYICCWGPRDDGAEMGGPGRLARRALRLGAQKGRAGKGSVFVWAAGNGGVNGDHCGADGYVNSIHSVAVGAVTHTGKPAFFGEPCPGVMAVTLTGASATHTPLVTLTNLGDGCVTHFHGTSSAAPIAAGILALVLEANPELTWREVQHLIAKTAKIPDPHEPGWSINGAGYHVHHRYGFGVLDAGLMVQQAVRFQTVPPQKNCTQEVTLDPTRVLASGGVVTVEIQSEGCDGMDTEINTLEHVQLKVNLSSVCRGDLSVELRSPSGTVSTLLGPRPNDASARGLRGWTMMSVHCWGERPRGVWTLQVTDHRGTVRGCGRQQTEESAGALHSVTLILYGTYDPHMTTRDGPPKTIVSMGSYHPVPQTGVYAGDRHPPDDAGLIHWTYRMESERKVRAGDIPIRDTTGKNGQQPLHPLLPLSYQQDGLQRNGSQWPPQLQEVWKEGQQQQQGPLPTDHQDPQPDPSSPDAAPEP